MLKAELAINLDQANEQLLIQIPILNDIPPWAENTAQSDIM
jgi:hypothetical protein